MPGNQYKPILLVDIDGVISLFGFRSDNRPDGAWLTVDGIAHYLSATGGEHLLALADDFDLVWCSGWEEKANEYLPLQLGLPTDLPFISFDRSPGQGGPHWKLRAIDAFVGPHRPVAWVDDALDERCDAWASARGAPTLLVRVEPPTGLTHAEVQRLHEWAQALDPANV